VRLSVNGEPREVKSARSVRELLSELELDAAEGMAVLVNEAVVPRSAWDETPLAEGDAVEILRASAGG
jgi:thiamine biosynthesis protein ThiS